MNLQSATLGELVQAKLELDKSGDTKCPEYTEITKAMKAIAERCVQTQKSKWGVSEAVE